MFSRVWALRSYGWNCDKLSKFFSFQVVIYVYSKLSRTLTVRTRIPKFSSIIYRLNEFIAKQQKKRDEIQKLLIVKRWLKGLSRGSPKILVGANFDRTGGVHYHVHAIQNFSSLEIELVPSDELMLQLGGWDFAHKYNDIFLKTVLRQGTVIHSHVYPWFIRWCRQKQQEGTRWVHTYHLPYFPEHAKGELLAWQTEINYALENDARFADVKLSVAKWQQQYLLDHHNIETLYLPNGVDVPLCDRADKQRFIAEIGYGDFILNVSRHDPVKNPAEFVELAQGMPDYKFVMIGPELTPELLLTEYDVKPPKNLLVYGPATHAKVQDAIAACSVLVSTSKREGLPTLVLEAMAHSKPVVVSNEPGSTEAIDYGAFGYSYEIGNFEDLKAKTLAAMGDRTIGYRARQRVLREYDWRVVAPQLDTIYRRTNLAR